MLHYSNPLTETVFFSARVLWHTLLRLVYCGWEQEAICVVCVYLLCATNKQISSSLVWTRYVSGPVSVQLAQIGLFTTTTKYSNNNNNNNR